MSQFLHHRIPGPPATCDGEYRSWLSEARKFLPAPRWKRCTHTFKWGWFLCICNLRFCSEACYEIHAAENDDAALVPRWQAGDRAVCRKTLEQGAIARVSPDGYGLVVALDAGGRAFVQEENWRKPLEHQGRLLPLDRAIPKAGALLEDGWREGRVA